MAKVTIKPAVTETKVVEVSPATYTLELNEQEFTALMVLVGIVGGEPEGIRNDVLTPLWESVFSKKYTEDHAWTGKGPGGSLYHNYRNQIKGNIYT